MWPVCKLKGGGGGKRGGGQGGMPGGHVIGDDALGDEREDASGKWGDVFRGSAGTTRARALARARTFTRIHAEIESVHTAHKCLGGASGFLDRARASTGAPWTLMRKQYCMLLLLSAPRVKRSEILHK
jgi:hypothetical protein